MRWSTSVGHLLTFNPAVIPQRKPKEETIVRPAGFTSNLSSMDVPRVGIAAKKRKRRIIIIAACALGLLVATIAISRLKPAVPSIDRSTVWIDTAKRGPMVRQVRGLGILTPEDIRRIPATTQGRVEKIILRPGTAVKPDNVILELTNPQLEQQLQDAELKLAAALAGLENLKVQLQNDLLQTQATGAEIEANFNKAKMQAQMNAALAKDQLVSELVLKQSNIEADQLGVRNQMAKNQLESKAESMR